MKSTPFLFGMTCLLTACSMGNEDAVFEFDGESNACIDEQFPKKFHQFKTEAYNGIARIRLYDTIALQHDSNYLGIDFLKYDANLAQPCPDIQSLIGQDIEITANGCVRAAYLAATCDPPQTFRIVGTLHLDAFSTNRDQSVTGALTGSLQRVVKIAQGDGNYAEKIMELGQISGSFDFVNRSGSIYDI